MYYDYYDPDFDPDSEIEEDPEYLDMVIVHIPTKQGEYCLGKCYYDNANSMILRDLTVNLEWVYKQNGNYIEQCMTQYGLSSFDNRLHILQIFKIDCPQTGAYIPYVVIKTYWLRIIQRTWKRVYNEWKRKICKPEQIYSRQITGKSAYQSLSLHRLFQCK